jgi:hypothetical protein
MPKNIAFTPKVYSNDLIDVVSPKALQEKR